VNKAAVAHCKQQQMQLMQHAQQEEQDSSAEQQQQELLTLQWQFKGTAPIFSSPVADEAAGLLLVAAVDGAVCGLGLETGQVMWRCDVQGHMFADLLLMQAHQQQVPAEATAAAAERRGPRRPAAAAAGAGGCVVVATQGGWVVGLSSRSGKQVGFTSASVNTCEGMGCRSDMC
jgi:hypothetical protein